MTIIAGEQERDRRLMTLKWSRAEETCLKILDMTAFQLHAFNMAVQGVTM